MKSLITISLIFLTSLVFCQSTEVVKLGLLPSAYGEGMPKKEFVEFERNFIKYLKRIPRFQIIGEQGKSNTISYEAVGGKLTIRNQQSEESTIAPYLLQMVFGDTDWSSSTNSPPRSNNRPPAPQQYQHKATVWVTLNVFEVSTGAIKKSLTLRAVSDLKKKNYKPAPPGPESVFINAVNSAQKSLWNKAKSAIHVLFPLEFSVEKIITKEGGKAKRVKINAGKYHGFRKGNIVFVYYEKEYMVRGKPTIRKVAVSTLDLIKVDRNSSVGNVLNGKKSLVELLDKEVELKCIVKDKQLSRKGYGF